MRTGILLIQAALLVMIGLQLKAQTETSVWTSAGASAFSKGKNVFEKNYKPETFKVFRLNEAVFKPQLLRAPEEKIAKQAPPFIITVPNSNGVTERFKIFEAPVMQPGLAAKFPQIKTYAGQGIDEPSSTIRFDISPWGFHAVILSANRKTIYINPVDPDNKLYIVFDRQVRADKNKIFDCSIEAAAEQEKQGNVLTGKNADDSKLRTYRLALTVNGEFSQAILDGSEANEVEKKAKVLSVLVTDLTRANAIYERDFDIRMMLVANNDRIIFLDPGTDPFTTSSKWNKQTEIAIDSLIEDDNYDIGHLLARVKTGNNGNAGCVACVCTTGKKGGGFTAHTTTQGDPLVVDFWTHEMGHQFGANHTFSFRDEGTGVQMEPGSGTTIMGYAGITGATDVQPHSDDYFHAVSIEQITDYVKSATGGGACAVTTATGDRTPVVNAGKDYVIPVSTPFVLTGTASDDDATADVLSYTWEQFDSFEEGSNTFPKSSSTTGPVFRSVTYSASPVRYFPDVNSVLSGSNFNKWEVLPAVSRKLNFRFTVRDNHAGGGNNNSDDMLVTVNKSAGPFTVTAPNSNVNWSVGDLQTITWSVANTTSPPVNCSKVNIALSVDGGLTFPVSLADNTANDGSEQISIPDNATKKARIRVMAADNIFFDISDADFTITSALPVTWLSFTVEKGEKNTVLLNWSTAREINNRIFEIERSTNSITYNNIGTVPAGNNGNEVQHYYFKDPQPFGGINYYRLKQTDADGRFKYSEVKSITLQNNTLIFTLYPNPAKNNATLKLLNSVNVLKIAVADASGKIMYSTNVFKTTAGQIINIPLRGFAKGVYVLKVNADGATKTEKLFVQ